MKEKKQLKFHWFSIGFEGPSDMFVIFKKVNKKLI